MFDWLGGVVYRRSRLILAFAGAFVVAAGLLATSAIDSMKVGGFLDPGAQSSEASSLINSQFGGQINLVFLLKANHGTADSPDVVAAGRRLTDDLAGEKTLNNVTSYWSTQSPTLKSSDGAYAVVAAHVVGNEDAAQKNTQKLYDKYHASNEAVTVSVGGGQGVNRDISTQVMSGLVVAEGIAVPLTLLLLVLAFGSLVAAALPLVIGLLAIVGTFGELAVLGRVTDVSIFSANLTTALGLGLGIDYALFMVARFRERLAAGSEVGDAVRTTVRTAGRTILFSALTVAAALATMAVFPLYFLRSFAYAGVGVVLIAAVASLFVVPALLAVLGHRVNALRLPWSTSVRGSEAPFWGRLAAAVSARPAVAALPVVMVLAVLAVPLFGVKFGTPDDQVLRATAESRVVTSTLNSQFTGFNPSAVQIVTKGAVAESALTDYAQQLATMPDVTRVDSSAGTFVDGRLVAHTPLDAARGRPDAQWLTVSTDLESKSDRAVSFVRHLRGMAGPGGTAAVVGGTDAELIDTEHGIGSRLPAAAAIIVVITFIVLFLFTGGVLQPLRALVLNSLSLSATLGAVVWIFQNGHLSGLFGFTPRPTDTAMTVLMFCVVFGLSMDYEVFLISRIKELHDQGVDSDEAVSQGLARTGRIVSTAAGMLAVTFFAFVPTSISFLQLFGFGAGLAVLIDAVLIRGVLVPATMSLLGRAAWWSPPPLRWVHTRVALAEQ